MISPKLCSHMGEGQSQNAHPLPKAKTVTSYPRRVVKPKKLILLQKDHTIVLVINVAFLLKPQSSLYWFWEELSANLAAQFQKATTSSGAHHSTPTYGYTHQRTRDPVRSPIFKLVMGEVVPGWVTTWEFSLLYVFLSFEQAPPPLDTQQL